MEIQRSQPHTPTSSDARMMAVAQDLEAAFLAEMLKSIDFGKQPEGFGGGSGEDQFASFMREEQARRMTAAGGIGLAQTLFEAMTGGQNVEARD
ncbi:rod-binding protein [Pseudooctadecabacter jejudonensis]|uniref:Chemotactic signal-response protein CheL n=1 Tax=Pseudooctadecabacter jejudonensis TaxID=1391910 RepID=A0A1Y5S3B4_9RHOB|nr:rod-binding protein [Pseudooctadecabacter jejudonensis]SLN31725.1 chemotactic signal-response protein CheL [Pseudooctadecabacter jejudonensis]